MILRGCCSSASIFGFFIDGSCIMIRSSRIMVSSAYLSMIFRKTSSHPSGGSPRAYACLSCCGCASLYTERAKKGRKDRPRRLICRSKATMRSAPLDPMSGQTSIRPHQRDIMGRTGQKGELPSKPDAKSKKKPPAPIEDDDIEDGDIATPKRDRSGNDDEPL